MIQAGDRRKEQWHVGREIPIAMLVALLLQSFGAVWWAATLSAKLDDLTYQVAALTADKYTQHDAARDQALTAQRFVDMDRRIVNLERGGKWRKE